MSSYIYAVRFGRYVKIGTSRNPWQRLLQLKSRFSGVLAPDDLDTNDVQPLFAVPGDMHTEHLIHLLVSEARVIGEWYNLTPRLQSWLDTVPEWYCLPFSRETPELPSETIRKYVAEQEAKDMENRVYSVPVDF